MTQDNTSSQPPITLGELRRLTASLPDEALLVLETAEPDFPATYERAALMLAVKTYGSGIYTVNLYDTPAGAA